MIMQDKLRQIDDVEKLRLKHLHNQQDELQRHIDSLKSVIHFSEKVERAETNTNDWSEVMLAIEKRANELEEARVAKKPVEDARLDFESVSEKTA